MITDYKVWPCPRKNPQADQNFRQKSATTKTFGRDPSATTWSTTKSSVVSHDFHPHPRFSFFWKDPNFDEGSQRFWKESQAHLRNLRKPLKRHSNLRTRESSAKTARAKLAYLQNLPNLLTFKKLAKLALQVCTLSATVCSSAVTRGG